MNNERTYVQLVHKNIETLLKIIETKDDIIRMLMTELLPGKEVARE